MNQTCSRTFISNNVIPKLMVTNQYSHFLRTLLTSLGVKKAGFCFVGSGYRRLIFVAVDYSTLNRGLCCLIKREIYAKLDFRSFEVSI